ncbi:MAG: M24 family metallopeptidase [Thermodesulfobacteriota bacterium]
MRAEFASRRIDALLVTDIRNIRYLSGFTGSSAYILITSGKKFFLTDSRYTTQVTEEVNGYRVRIYKKALEAVTGIIALEKIGSLGFESDSLTYDTFLKLRKQLPGVRLKPAPGITGKARVRKDPFEIDRIRDSARVLDAGFAAVARVIGGNVTEKEAASRIELAFREAGADTLAFDTIVASGPRAALPHGKASSKKIKKGELVVVDMGVVLDGYNSDETRTFCVGRPTAEQRKVYATVLEAQSRAIEKTAPGVKASDVDAAARGVIEKAGYGKFFGHGTGHGVGLDVHEGPSIGPLAKGALEEGMVITVEPGIYVPGWGGVRIEDMVLVTKDGFDVLTATSKDLVSL